MPEHIVTISGKIIGKRDLGALIFLEIDTPGQPTQVVARKNTASPNLFQTVKTMRTCDYCRLEIIVEKNDQLIHNILTHIKKHREAAWSPRQVQVIKAYAFLLTSLREFFNQRYYTEVRLPAIHYGKTKSDAFAIDFFGKNARLTSSNSLFLDIYAIQLQKAYTLQKCFRAEKSRTTRHLAEFDMLEAAELDSTLEQTMETLEHLVRFVLEKFKNSPFAALRTPGPIDITQKTFEKIEYREIARQYSLQGRGLGKYEKEIARHHPVFVTHFPRQIASWSARPLDRTYARSFNLLLPGVGETAEGTEKQTDMNAFRKKLQAAHVEEQLGWYIRMNPYTNYSLTSFGLGVERLAMWLMGLPNIRGIHPVYRDTRFSEQEKTGNKP